MRKRNFKFALSEIFWHIVYFLPVIMGLLSLAVFSTGSFVTLNAKGEETTETKVVTSSEETVTASSDTSTLLNKVVTFKDSFDLYDYQGGMGSTTFNLDFFVDYDGVDGVEEHLDCTSLVVAMDYNANGGSQLLYDGAITYDSIFGGFLEPGYERITITGGADVESISVLDFFYGFYSEQWIECVTDYVPPVEEVPDDETETPTITVYEYMKDGFDSAMKVVGYNPENDLIYGMFSKLFITGDLFPVFGENTFLLQFIGYFIYVHILRFFVDLLLWIPNYVRKLMNEGFKGDQ